MILVADSSALVALATVDKLDVLEKLFGKVYVPRAVKDIYFGFADGRGMILYLH